ncbi:SLATT domain-containing protein [Streptomyces sp. NPDC002917]|uniref:SLATT domain-containing protein n=1 Tax=Streptomyces sp. NPDC002917 TaxID=3364671 RepID=UPI003690E890
MRNRVRARDGRHLMVERLGDPRGRPVFLLHGMPGSRLGPAPRGMVLYQRKTQLITYDRPGYGGSDRLAGRPAGTAHHGEPFQPERVRDGPHILHDVRHAVCRATEAAPSMDWSLSVKQSTSRSGRWTAQHPEAVFANRLEEGLQELRKVGWVDPRDEMGDAGGGLITESMRELRSRAFTVRKETYIRDRLIEQRRWYRRRQHVSRRGALVWSSAIAALTTPALALSLLQTFGAARSFTLTGALSAAAAACLAWNEMRRHHPLISAHSLVEKDLESMQAAMETSLTERQWPVAVFETERIVSPEHTDWLARHRM